MDSSFPLYKKISRYGVYQYFVRHYFKGMSIQEIRQQLSLTFEDTRTIISNFSIETINKKIERKSKGCDNRAFILENYKSMTSLQLAIQLNLSRQNVIGYCKRMKIEPVKCVRQKKIKSKKQIDSQPGKIDRSRFCNYSNHSPYGIADELRISSGQG